MMTFSKLSLGILLLLAVSLPVVACSRRHSSTTGNSRSGISVTFDGNLAIAATDLADAVGEVNIAPDDNSNDDDVIDATAERAALLVSALYYDRGYLDAVVDPPRVVRKGRGGDVRIPVAKEGAAYVVSSVKIGEVDEDDMDELDDTVEGPPCGDDAALSRSIHLHRGERFSGDVLRRDLDAVRRSYRDNGYANVDVTPDLVTHPENATVDIIIPVRKNSHARVNRIGFVVASGARAGGPSESSMRRQLAVHEGDVFNETKLEESRRRLEALGFTQVDISTEPGSNGSIAITFELSR